MHRARPGAPGRARAPPRESARTPRSGCPRSCPRSRRSSVAPPRGRGSCPAPPTCPEGSRSRSARPSPRARPPCRRCRTARTAAARPQRSARSRRARYGSDSVARVNERHVHEVAIVGAGFGGLGMAIRLKQQGIEDFVLLERGADVGGTWWSNSYPGAQCDIPSNLYSFSFAPNPDWSRAYPLRDEIQAYLRRCAERFGVLSHVRLKCELLGASWLGDEQRWELETSNGPLSARMVVAAPGLLSEP